MLHAPEAPPPSDERIDAEARNLTGIRSLVAAGHIGRAAARAICQPVLSANDPAVRAQLEALHPRCRGRLPTPPPDHRHINIFVEPNEQFRKFIREHLVTGAAAGPSGWTGEMLDAACDHKEVLEGVALLCQHMLNGTLPTSLADYLCGSNLTPLDKGVPDRVAVRPIAVPEVFYKLAASWICKRHSADMLQAVGPHQYGVGMAGGAEKILHALRRLCSDRRLRLAAVQVDFKNAFNCMDREHMLRRLYSNPRLAALWPIVHFAYGRPTLLHLHQGLPLLSQQGARQGDPLGSFLFANGLAADLQATIDAIADRRVAIFSFLDNIIIVGPPELVERAVTTLLERVRPIAAGEERKEGANSSRAGLTCVTAKSEVWWWHDDPLPDSLQRLVEQGFRLINAQQSTVCLGAPIGGESEAARGSIRRAAADIVASHNNMFELLRSDKLPTQVVLLLLRASVLPRLTYIARVVPPDLFADAAAAFDRQVLDTLLARLGWEEKSLSSFSRASISMPLRHGGLGLRRHAEVAPIAYYASLAAAVAHLALRSPAEQKDPLLSESQANHIRSIRERLIREAPATRRLLPPDSQDPVSAFVSHFSSAANSAQLQNRLTLELEKERHTQRLAEMKSDHERVRLEMLSRPGSGLVFTLYPGSDGRCSLSDRQMEMCIAFRLYHSPLADSEGPTRVPCECGLPLDLSTPEGYFHPLGCNKFTAQWKRRHDSIVNLLSEAAEANGALSIKEPPPPDGKERLIPDLYVAIGAKCYLSDVIVVHSLTESRLHLNSGSASRRALSAAYNLKMNKYRAYAQQIGAELVPFAVDIVGVLDKDARKLLQHIASDDSGGVGAGVARSPLCNFNFLQCRVAVVVAEGNSALLDTALQRILTNSRNADRAAQLRLQSWPQLAAPPQAPRPPVPVQAAAPVPFAASPVPAPWHRSFHAAAPILPPVAVQPHRPRVPVFPRVVVSLNNPAAPAADLADMSLGPAPLVRELPPAAFVSPIPLRRQPAMSPQVAQLLDDVVRQVDHSLNLDSSNLHIQVEHKAAPVVAPQAAAAPLAAAAAANASSAGSVSPLVEVRVPRSLPGAPIHPERIARLNRAPSPPSQSPPPPLSASRPSLHANDQHKRKEKRKHNNKRSGRGRNDSDNGRRRDTGGSQ
jgi:hypothetical protein